MSHVFISYAREDIDFAGAVRAKLEEAGLGVWLDTRAIEAGVDWGEEIDRALADAVAVLLVMSPAAKASEYVAFEWAYALGSGARVIPLLYRATDLHPRLARLQYLDFSSPLVRPWTELLAQLDALDSASAHRARRLPRDAPSSVREAFAALDSAEYKPRRQAISALAEMSHPSAVAALVFALEHPSLDVRAQAAETLANRGDARAIPALLALLESEDWGDDAVDSMIALGAAAVEPMLEVLNDPAQGTLRRHVAAFGLAQTSDAAARAAARGWTRWTYRTRERLPEHPTGRSTSIYSAAGYRSFVRKALDEIAHTGAAARAPAELERLHVGAVLHHWKEVERAARGESAHAIPLPLWIEYADGVDVELTIAIARRPELSDPEVAALFTPPSRSAKKKRAKRG